jgi:hypothetical protein
MSTAQLFACCHAVVVSLCAGRTLRAQDRLPVAPTLEYAITGGYWTQGGVGGQYRLLVYTGGFDHVVSQFELQWLQDPSPQDSAAVRRSVPVKEISGVWRSGGVPTVRRTDLTTVYTIDLLDSHRPTAPPRRCTVTPGPIGTYRVACNAE